MHGVHFIEHERENSAARDEARAAVAESEALDAYSTIVASVADRVTPSVTSLRVARRPRGGGLADSRGRVVGINTAVAGVGLGLAVPINRTTGRILTTLMREGRFRRAYLGIAGGRRPLPPRLAQTLGRRAGVEVVEVVDGS